MFLTIIGLVIEKKWNNKLHGWGGFVALLNDTVIQILYSNGFRG